MVLGRVTIPPNSLFGNSGPIKLFFFKGWHKTLNYCHRVVPLLTKDHIIRESLLGSAKKRLQFLYLAFLNDAFL